MKITTLLLAILITVTGFSQQDTIVKWTFPTGELTDLYPDFYASPLNQNKTISTDGGVSAIEMKNGATTSAAQASGWDNGQGTKSWQIEVDLTGKYNIRLNSKQSAGGNDAGPKDFKLQYKVGSNGTWGDVAYGTVLITNDWELGNLENVELPLVCENQPSVFIRWLMVSNLSINGAPVQATGKAKIDDIIITGTNTAGINDFTSNLTELYPNPCTTSLNIKSNYVISSIEVYSITGSKVISQNITGIEAIISTDFLNSGYYMIRIEYSNGNSETRKFMIK